MADLASLQDDVLTTAQANELYGESRVRSAVGRGLWQRPYRGVIVLHNGPLTPSQRRWGHLLFCAPGSVLGGPTALELEGMTGFATPSTFVVLPEGARKPTLPGLVTHWSTVIDERDVNPMKLPPRTRPARSLIDFASWSSNPAWARTIVLAGHQQRLVRTGELRDALTRRGTCLHRALIVESYLDAAGGIQSLPERDFDQIRISRGLPEPTRQRIVRGPTGRYYLDVDWDQYAAACEIHGAPHLAVQQWTSDLARGNEITIGGRRTVFFTSYGIRREKDLVGDQLERFLRSRGWRPESGR